MATLTATNPSFNRSATGRLMATEQGLVDGAATFKAGQFLRRASDGLLYEGTSGAALGVGDDAITHYALESVDSAIGNDTTRKWVGIVHEDDIYEMNELDTTVAEASKGQHCGMNVTSNVCTADISDTTNPVFQIVNPTWRERGNQDSSADTLARMLVKVLSTAIYATPTN